MAEDFELFMESQGEEKPEEFPNLPIELQGKDLTPDETEKLKNTFQLCVIISQSHLIVNRQKNLQNCWVFQCLTQRKRTHIHLMN